jgi:hypothetical protein
MSLIISLKTKEKRFKFTLFQEYAWNSPLDPQVFAEETDHKPVDQKYF